MGLEGLANESDLQAENRGDQASEDSLASGSSGFGSLPRKAQRSSLVTSPGIVGFPSRSIPYYRDI